MKCTRFILLIFLLFCISGCVNAEETNVLQRNTTTTAISVPSLTENQQTSLISLLGVHYPPDSDSDPFPEIQVLGSSNDIIICQYNNGTNTSEIQSFLGGYKIGSGVINEPSPLGLYAITADGRSMTLEEAYRQSLVNIAEVYSFLPTYMKKGATIEEDFFADKR